MPYSRSILTAISLACVLVVGGLAPVSATTGPTRLLQKPKFFVDVKLARTYRGQYVLKMVAPAARIHDAAMGIEINEYNWMYGVAQFYGYDNQGFQTSWVATLYNFHAMPHNRMNVDILGSTGQPFLGRFFLTRQKNGDLMGRILLGHIGGRTYAVSFHKLNSR